MKRIISISAGLLAACICSIAQESVQSAAEKAAAAFANKKDNTEQFTQKPQYWKTSADFTVGFNQTGLFNWASGGYNTLTLSAGIDLKANYEKDLHKWNNRLQTDYGFLWSADKANLLQKSKDRIYLESKWSYRTKKDSKWSYSAGLDFRSQFTDSYDSYQQDQQSGKWSGKLKSSFFAPAYTTLSLGMDWVPANWFNISVSPLTGGVTVCVVPDLKKSYGMKPIEGSTTEYSTSLFQLGAQMKMNFMMSINDVVKYETQLVLFTDYLNHPFNNNRVNWDNKISWQVAKNIRIGLDTWLIYDPIVLIDGTQKVQFKEFLSVNFSLGFSNKR